MKFKLLSLLFSCICIVLLPFFNGAVSAENAPGSSAAGVAAGAQAQAPAPQKQVNNKEDESTKKEFATGAKETAKGIRKMFNSIKKLIKPIKTELIVGTIAVASIPLSMTLAVASDDCGLRGVSTFFSWATVLSWLTAGGCLLSGVGGLIK